MNAPSRNEIDSIVERQRSYEGKRKTCKRQDVPGDAHSLTFSCYRRQAFLSRDRSRRWFVEALSAARQEHKFDLWAYVVMPEHVHLLIFPRDDHYSMSGILLDIKRPVARKAVRYVKAHAPAFLDQMRDQQPNGVVRHRFWQRGGGYDRNLIDAKTIHNTMAYIHANPVRRGLVESAEDWSWSSAGFYSDRQVCPLKPDADSIPPLDLDGT